MFNLMTPCSSFTSYGIVGMSLNHALRKLGANPTLWPIGQADSDADFPDYSVSINESLAGQGLYEILAPTVRIFHQFALAERIGLGHLYGFPIFELDRFNKVERHHLKNCDALIVCSDWAEQVLRNNGFSGKINVVPLGVNREIYHENYNIPNNGPTTFISVGKLEKRKCHDILHKAFRAAFSPNDNVQLVMFAFNPFVGAMNDHFVNEYKQLLGNQVVFHGRTNTKTMVKIMAGADCAVQVSRAEGWGLPILEFLSLGKCVISTNYSGQSHFLNKENSLLVEIDTDEIANDGLWFIPEKTEGGQWAYFGDDQFDCLVQHMRKIHALKQMGCLSPNFEGIETAKRFTWENSAKALLKAIGD
jgi:glycosyltransferase involved in cell wall biosynthesis